MKKANELNRRYGVKVAVFVYDSVVPNEWAYQSDQLWVPDFSNLSVGPGKTHFIPSDFITLSEYHKSGIILSRPDYNSTMSPLRFSSSLLPNNLNDMDNTLLRALGYPSIDTSKTNASLSENNNYEINHNRKRSISTGSDYPVKKTKQSAELSNQRPVTRSDSKYRINLSYKGQN